MRISNSESNPNQHLLSIARISAALLNITYRFSIIPHYFTYNHIAKCKTETSDSNNNRQETEKQRNKKET